LSVDEACTRKTHGYYDGEEFGVHELKFNEEQQALESTKDEGESERSKQRTRAK
jgi:hypothetical protein